MKTTTLTVILAIGNFLPVPGLSAEPLIQFGPVAYYTNTVDVNDAICTGDFNGDRQMELVTMGNHAVTLWTNNGAGGFAVETYFVALGNPRAVTTGDLNQDGKLDLLTANYSGDSVSAFLGDGTGHFSRVDTLLSVNHTRPGLAVGDFNEDGLLDATLVANQIKVLLGHGDGAFTASSLSTQGNPMAVAVADLDGDHHLDLVTANYSSPSLSVYRGNGNGTFQAPTAYSGDFSEYRYAVTTGDWNKDGKPDLATVSFYSQSISVRLNNGDGTFGAETRYPGIVGANSLALGDFDHDGNLDLVAGQTSSSYELAILPGKGDGTFGTALTNFTGLGFSGAFKSLAVADFDGDGLVDLASTCDPANPVSVRLNQSVALLQIKRLASTPPAPKIRLQWPSWPGYQLEHTVDLRDARSWVPVAQTPALVGNQKVLTNTALGLYQFYRLRKPAP